MAIVWDDETPQSRIVWDDNPPKTIGQKIFDSKALPIAGGVIGGITGGIPGAALGGAAGEAFRQIGAKATGTTAPQTSGEAIKGIGTEAATQAISETVAGKVLSPAVKAVGGVMKKPAGQLLEIITKIKPQYAETLFKNPKAIFPKQWEMAKNAWREAAQKAGLPIDDVSPEIINALKTDAKKTVFEAFENIQKGAQIPAGTVQTAKQALDIALMPAAKTERNAPLVALYSKMRQAFTDQLGKSSPELSAANKQYAIAKAGKKFRSVFPRNLDDSPAYFRSTIPSLMLGMGASRDDSYLSGLAKSAGIAAAASPISIGTGIALAGAGRSLGPVIGRAAVSAASETIKDKRRKLSDYFRRKDSE